MSYAKKMKLSKVIIFQKSKKSKVIIRQKSKKIQGNNFPRPDEMLEKTAIVTAFSFALLHKPRKHPQTIGIRLEHVFGMPLHGADEAFARHFYGFDEAVEGDNHRS